MIEIKAPGSIANLGKDNTKIFLAGSIEMGVAEGWQEIAKTWLEAAIDKLSNSDKSITSDQLVLLNPRRDDWDASWKQTGEHPQFHQQVTWELSSLSQADWILMYFDPATKSPISLLELGLFASSGKLVVVCPDGFWRKGNVDIVCDTYQIMQQDTLINACYYILEQENLKRAK